MAQSPVRTYKYSLNSKSEIICTSVNTSKSSKSVNIVPQGSGEGFETRMKIHRVIVMLLILGDPTFLNHFRPFLSQKLGAQTYFHFSLSQILRVGGRYSKNTFLSSNFGVQREKIYCQKKFRHSEACSL